MKLTSQPDTDELDAVIAFLNFMTLSCTWSYRLDVARDWFIVFHSLAKMLQEEPTSQWLSTKLDDHTGLLALYNQRFVRPQSLGLTYIGKISLNNAENPKRQQVVVNFQEKNKPPRREARPLMTQL